MLNSSPVPYGYQFRPSRQEIFIRFLFPIVNGECLPSSPLIQVDIYGENKEPWNIFDKNSKTPYWVFTKLKKKSRLRIDRTAGSGCWLARNTKEVYDNGGKLLGYHKYFTFSCKNDEWMNQDNGHWIMHEFSLKREESNDYVICEIRNKNAADLDSDSKLNTKKRRILSSEKNHEEMNLPSKPNDEEMGLISIFSESGHKDLSSDVTFETRTRNDGLDLNLNLKLNDEDLRLYVNHEDPKIINKDVAGRNLNLSKLESDDEEIESISRSSNHEDLSSDVTFEIRNRNDDLGLNLNLKSNDEDGKKRYLRQNVRISDDSPLYIFPNFIIESNKFEEENLFKSIYENLFKSENG
ncbi:NAC transcription factor 29 [Gossypium hirsutum]|uniref:NAC transcription factor 29 n=1 Tax=Gossypium hirsutum TaxID=3635 RepID=A0ABM2ZRQ1_GOSHI|nr:NAC transcription factor 29-like [Gossypium hirsutum]